MAESVVSNEQYVDLHTHTKHSDGELTTEQLLRRAVEYKLSAIAITDHDSVAAYVNDQEILARIAHESGLEVVPGIELSTTDAEGNKRHILGLGINPFAPELTEVLEDMQLNRLRYTSDTCNILQFHGWHIDTEGLLSQSATITKAHIARALLADARNKALWTESTGTETPTEGQLIEATIAKDKPFYISKEEDMRPERAVEIIHKVGGVAILAHPSFNLMKGESFANLERNMLAWHLDGVEAVYVQYDRSDNDREADFLVPLLKFADRHGLLITGGSDFHTDSEAQIGKYIDVGFYNHPWKVPIELLTKVKQRSSDYRR